MSDDPAKPPRFPYIAALLCAACIGAAVWTWMRYSYCWNAMGRDLFIDVDNAHVWPNDSYVALQADIIWAHASEGGKQGLVAENSTGDSFYVWVPSATLPDADHRPDPFGYDPNTRRHIVARVLQYGADQDAILVLDATGSRWHAASIAGLVVGAMGVFVFTVAFRHWLGERRRFRERTEGA